jgi:glyoxylase-like metal-dependent hydrolase (beta-lactamase superfamily II)
LDFDAAAMRISQTSAGKLLEALEQKGLQLKWIFETHAHADHLTAARWLKEKTGAPIAIGQSITKVQQTFNQLFELHGQHAARLEDFDHRLEDGEQLALGELSISVLAIPGYTPSCCTYLIGDCAFVGDTLFMPDFGTARCDFPG